MSRILIIDDEELLRESLKTIIETAPHEVICADNGKSALNLLKREKPDLILLDLIMPDMDGIEFLRIMRSKKIKIPVLIMSGNPIGIDFFRSAELLGAKGRLEKPFSSIKLLSMINDILK